MNEKKEQLDTQRVEVILKPYEDDKGIFERYKYLFRYWKILLISLVVGTLIGGIVLFLAIRANKTSGGADSAITTENSDKSFAQMRLTILSIAGGLTEMDEELRDPAYLITSDLLAESAEAMGLSVEASKLFDNMTITFETPLQSNANTWRIRLNSMKTAGISEDKALAYMRELAHQIDLKLIGESDNRERFYFETNTLFAETDEWIALNKIEKTALAAYTKNISVAQVYLKSYIDDVLGQMNEHVGKGAILAEAALSYPALVHDKESAITTAQALYWQAARDKDYWTKRYDAEKLIAPDGEISADVMTSLREASILVEQYSNFLIADPTKLSEAPDEQALKLQDELIKHASETYELAKVLNASIDVYYENSYLIGLSKTDDFGLDFSGMAVKASTESMSLLNKLMYLALPALALLFIAAIYVTIRERAKTKETAKKER